MGQLRDILLHPATRSQVVSDCEALIAKEVAGKSGLSGTVIKTLFGAVNKLGAGFIPKVIDRKLLDPFVDQLEPFHLAATATKVAFVQYMHSHAAEVAQALLSITDKLAERSANAVLTSLYKKARSMATKHVEAAVPAIADLVVSHLSRAEGG